MRASARPRRPILFAPWNFAIAWAASLSVPSAADKPGVRHGGSGRGLRRCLQREIPPRLREARRWGWDGRTILPVSISRLLRQRCRPFSTASQASGWGWNSIPRILCGSTLTRSVRRGSSKAVSSRCMPRIRRSLSLYCSKWALPGRDGGVIGFPDRGLSTGRHFSRSCARSALTRHRGGARRPFWDVPGTADLPDFPERRKDGFVLARRFLEQYLPGRQA